MYSRTAYMALKAETTEGTAVTPDVFIPLMSEDIVTEYGVTPAMPISGNRAMNLRGIETAIPAPSGTINLLAEPKTLGYFLKGVYGAVSTGEVVKINTLSADFTVGETVTGGTSAATATVVKTSTEGDYVLVSTSSGAFTVGETITGGTSGSTATVVSHSQSVYGHEFSAPQSSLPTYTVEFGLDNEAYRYTGVRFTGVDSITPSDNIMSLAVQFSARYEYKHARVTDTVSTGAGSTTITVDQTTGLVAGDTIKVYRAGTGFLDFSAASTLTHTIDSVDSETAFKVTDIETALAVGDLIVLAPQTPSYSIDKEFSFIGGTTMVVDSDITTAVSGTADCLENFELSLVNDGEYRHCANGANLKDRFPGKYILRGLTGSGSLTRVYTDMKYLDRLRNSTELALFVKHEGDTIGTTGLNYELHWRVPKFILGAFNANISEDEVVNQEMPFDVYDSSDDGYFQKALLINNVSGY